MEDINKILALSTNIVYDNTDNVIIILDKKGKILYANKRVEEWIGYKKEELIGKNVFLANILTSKAIKTATVNLAKRFLGEHIPPYRLEFITKGGQHLFGIVRGYLIKDEKNNILGDLVLISDITEKEIIEKAYFHEKEKLELFLNLIQMMVVILNKKGEIFFLNKKACSILKIDRERAFGLNWFDNFLLDEDKERVRGVFNKIMAGYSSEVEYYENKIVTKDKEIMLIFWHNSYIKDEDGNIAYTISIGEDITEKQKQQQALLTKTKELEQLTKLMVGRELKMIELKEKLKNLKNES